MMKVVEMLLSSSKTRNHSSYIADTTVADDLVMPGIKTLFSWIILTPALEVLM